MTMVNKTVVTASLLALGLGLVPRAAQAHCDALDGPVVKAAQKALETGKLGPVLAWVKPADEGEIKAVFQKALVARKQGAEAKDLADRYFFETLVRVHRAGEGAPFTGLKPAGRDIGPAIPAADKALEQGSADAVGKLLTDAVKSGLAERFKRVKSLKAPGDDPAQGREWVEAYVPFLHYVEGIYRAASGAPTGAEDEGTHARGHAEEAHR
jgi:hypothetical protein